MTAVDTEDLKAVLSSLLTKRSGDPSSRPSFDAQLWADIQVSGFDQVLVPDPDDGFGGSFADLAAVLVSAGSHAAAVPLAEASLGAALVARAGGEALSGVVTLSQTPSPLPRTGLMKLADVPYAQHADAVVVVSPVGDGTARVHLLHPGRARVTAEHPNLAGEPRADLEVEVSALESVGGLPSMWQVTLQLAAARALLMAGALERARDLAVSYTRLRAQFGGPIIRFQAVQALVVDVVTSAEVAHAMCECMVQCFDGDDDPRRLELAVAAARVVTGHSAVTAFRAAHQILGAMGFTKEHELHLYTTRVLAWREEDLPDRWWAEWLGRQVRESGENGLWQMVTGAS